MLLLVEKDPDLRVRLPGLPFCLSSLHCLALRHRQTLSLHGSRWVKSVSLKSGRRSKKTNCKHSITVRDVKYYISTQAMSFDLRHMQCTNRTASSPCNQANHPWSNSWSTVDSSAARKLAESVRLRHSDISILFSCCTTVWSDIDPEKASPTSRKSTLCSIDRSDVLAIL